MNNVNWTLGLKIVALALALTASAYAAWVVQGEKVVSFRAVGPGGLAFVGKGSDISIREQGTNLSVVVGLQGLTTGIALRDSHMRNKYLETAKYPTALLVVEKSKLTFPSNGAYIDGMLTLHGVTKPVRVQYTLSGVVQQVRVEGNFHVNMKEFGIRVPSYLGVTVKPDIHVSAKFDATDK